MYVLHDICKMLSFHLKLATLISHCHLILFSFDKYIPFEMEPNPLLRIKKVLKLCKSIQKMKSWPSIEKYISCAVFVLFLYGAQVAQKHIKTYILLQLVLWRPWERGKLLLENDNKKQTPMGRTAYIKNNPQYITWHVSIHCHMFCLYT